MVILAMTLMLAIFLMPLRANAHPHVWVTTKTEILHDAQGRITAFRHHWTFDEIFSAMAAQGMDANKDGKFTRKELAELAKINITSLSEYDFFTYVETAKSDVSFREPEDGYYLTHEDGKLTLHFVLPLQTPLDARKDQVKFAIYDPTYYVAYSYAEKSPVWLASNAPKECKVEMQKPPPLSSKEVSLSDLSEAFSNEMGLGSDIGSEFAPNILIACATS